MVRIKFEHPVDDNERNRKVTGIIDIGEPEIAVEAVDSSDFYNNLDKGEFGDAYKFIVNNLDDSNIIQYQKDLIWALLGVKDITFAQAVLRDMAPGSAKEALEKKINEQ